MSDPAARADASKFERLEALVRELIERHGALVTERARLQERLAQREARLQFLDAQLVESNQTRRDAAKRVDELIAQLERVQQEVERRLNASTVAVPE